ncbi:MAG: farnesyl diphosphate synthase [Bacillota bacterium]|nr:farnesyl diphosphate synthase [Bacillota bacterium]
MNDDYKKIKNLIEMHLTTFFKNGNNNHEKRFNEIVNYSLLAGGKRLRPVLLYKTTELLKGNLEYALDLACALEMIHTYSLVHDDLPAMDDDDYRRGNLTSHKVYGDAMAILAGDALLNRAYQIIISTILDSDGDKGVIKASELIAKSAGFKGMIIGQVVDIDTENKDISNDVLNYIIENKTGKLLIAAIVSAGYLSDLSESEIELLNKAAYHIGYSFQLIDDYLDVAGDYDHIGKSIGKDNKLGKNTYVKYNGIERTKSDAQNHLNIAKDTLKMIKGYNLDFLFDIIEYLKNREK